MTDQQQVKQQFWSIERVVAFVVTPIATPLSGAVALWLAKHFPGLHLTGDAVYAFAATVAGGTAAALIKWLDGRLKIDLAGVATNRTLESKVGELAAPIFNVLPPAERKSLLAEIEQVVKAESAKLGARLAEQAKPPPAAPPTAEPPAAEGGAAITGS